MSRNGQTPELVFYGNCWGQCRSSKSLPMKSPFSSVSSVIGHFSSPTGLQFIRRKEMVAIRKILIIRAANQAMAFSIPTLAAVLSFVTYGSTQDSLDPVSTRTEGDESTDTSGSDLHFFGAIQPSSSAVDVSTKGSVDVDGCTDRCTEARTGAQCLQVSWLTMQIFAAKVIDRDRRMDSGMDVGLRLSNVTFRWAAFVDPGYDGDEKRGSEDRISQASTAIDRAKPEAFSLDDIEITVPRGLLVALVGRVGSGKSSLLQGVRRLVMRF